MLVPDDRGHEIQQRQKKQKSHVRTIFGVESRQPSALVILIRAYAGGRKFVSRRGSGSGRRDAAFRNYGKYYFPSSADGP
jgi:hypothetical protein